MAKIKGVILDIDGTLVDSNDAHAHAWVEALQEQGVAAQFEAIRPLIGMGGDKLLPEATGIREDSPDGQTISKRRGEIFKQKYLPKLRPTRGAPELLKHLKERGLRLVIATSAKADELTGLMKICGADRVIDDKTSSDEAERSKPDPDIVHAALKKIGLKTDEVLMLGDTPYDIQAARKAGIGTISVRCGGWDDVGLKGAVAVYDDPADLLAQFDKSPLMQRLVTPVPSS